MSRDPRKKERQRLKRKQKKLKMRRENSRTVLQRIASEGGTLECWINSGWRENGLAAILVLGQAHGRFACATFLVDVWCVGLKDAWGRPEVGEVDFRDEILPNWLDRHPSQRILPAEAARLVAAGIQFSRKNGFRLPAHWGRWASIFGSSLPDSKTLDISDFGVEGKLRYVGDTEFLRNRLIACTPQEFIERPDVQWLMPMSPADEFEEFYEDQEEEEDEDTDAEIEDFDNVAHELLQSVKRISATLDTRIRKWCDMSSVAPHPQLENGSLLMVMAIVPLAASLPDLPPEEKIDFSPARQLAARFLSTFPESEREGILEATEQVRQYLLSFANPEDAFKALQIEGAVLAPTGSPLPTGH